MSRRKVYVTDPDGGRHHRTTDRDYKFAVLVATDAATELAHEQERFDRYAQANIDRYVNMTPDDSQYRCRESNIVHATKQKAEWEKRIAAMPREGTVWGVTSWHGSIEQARKGAAKVQSYAVEYRVRQIVIHPVDPA